MSSQLLTSSLISSEWDFDMNNMCNCVKLFVLKVFKSISLLISASSDTRHSENDTWTDLDESVVLDEDGVTGQVAMDDRRITWVEITAEEEK